MKRISVAMIVAALLFVAAAFVPNNSPSIKAAATVRADEGFGCSLASVAGNWGLPPTERLSASDPGTSWGYSPWLLGDAIRGCIVRRVTIWRSDALLDKANKGVHRTLTVRTGVLQDFRP